MAAQAPRHVDATPSDLRPTRDTDFGLVVGVDHYPRFRSLQGAVADARRVHSWLCDPDGGGVAPENARLVVSRPEPAAPLQDEIDDQLLALIDAAKAAGGGRRLYFHFSGHGASSPNGAGEDVALLLAKWSQSLERLALSTEEYRGGLGKMGLFEEIVVFLDCCRTAEAGAIGLPPTITFRPYNPWCATRMFIAYATEAGRSAFEVLDHELWQGVFTRCLLTILRRAPHGITAAELKRALEQEVEASGQRPYVQNGLLDDSRFGRRGEVPTLRVTFVRARGRVTLRNGARAVVAAHDAGQGPWELQLEAGLYKLEDDDGITAQFDHGEAVTHVVL
jgi:hypothetical protein